MAACTRDRRENLCLVFKIQSFCLLSRLCILLVFAYYAAVINAVFYRAAKESGFGGSPVKERVSGIAAL